MFHRKVLNINTEKEYDVSHECHTDSTIPRGLVWEKTRYPKTNCRQRRRDKWLLVDAAPGLDSPGRVLASGDY